MSFIASIGAIAAVGSVAAGAYGAYETGQAAKDASKDQKNAANAGIDEQRRQFDAIQKLLAPYVTSGTAALTGQQDLTGLNGPGAQSAAIQALQASPAFTSAQKTGEDSILAHAAATGGLRGGNVQSALAQFSPALLTSLINDQYTKLGGLSQQGLGAATGTGNAGLSTGNNVTTLLQQIGAANAGGALAQGKANVGYANAIGQGLGTFAGAAFSDLALKENVVPIGMTRRGNRLYRWDWKATGLPGAGVIAQEVEHIPGAVTVDPATGFKKVAYDRV